MSGGQSFVAEVFISLKPGVNDPQGIEIANGLKMLGFDEVDRARSGKYIQVWITAPDEASATERARDMCEKLLANTIVETYHLAIRAAEPAH